MKINVTNTTKINAAIVEAEGRATARCIGADYITAAIEKFERADIMPKKDMIGLKLFIQVGFGGKVPNSYRGTPESSYAWVERCPSGWFLIVVGRSRAPAYSVTEMAATLTAQAAILRQAMTRNYA